MFERSHNRKNDTFPRVCVLLLALSVPPVLWLWDLPPETFAGCATYGYACTEVACLGVEISTDYGYTWRDDSVYIYGPPQSAVYLYVRTVLGVLWGDVEGWSFGVRHDGSALEAAGGELTLNAAGAGQIDTVKCGYPPDFKDTQIRPCGYTQGVVIDYGSTGCTVSAPRVLVTSYACYRVVMPPTEGVYPVTLKLTDDVGDPPIDSMVVQGGQSKAACRFDLTLNVYSTSSYYPTPSYCPLYQQTPVACAQGGGGGGGGQLGEEVPQTRRLPQSFTTGTEPDGPSTHPRITPDGRYVAFASQATNLDPAPGHNGPALPQATYQIYRVTRNDDGTTVSELLSLDTTETAAGASCYHPSISDDGNAVVFDTRAALVPDDTSPDVDPNARLDVYARNISAGTTTLVSSAEGQPGIPGNGPSDRPAVSGDGAFVAYTSEARDLQTSVIVDPGTPEQVYRTGADGTGTILATEPLGVLGGGARTADPEPDPPDPPAVAVGSVINQDGEVVVFQGAAFLNADDQIWMRHVSLNDLRMVYPTPGDAPSRNPTVSLAAFDIIEDARVAFSSVATNLAGGATSIEDVYWLENPIQPALINVTDGQDGASTRPMLDETGLWVTFSSQATGLAGPGGDTNGLEDVFLAEIDPSTASLRRIELVSLADDGAQAQGGLSRTSDLSEDVGGVRTVVFESEATNLLGAGVDQNAFRDVFERLLALADFRRGDSDGSGAVNNLTDAIVILNYLFRGGTRPGCDDAADADDTGTINLTDAVRILRYLFQGGAPPPAPGPDSCGLDPTPDNLGCLSVCL